MAKGTRPTTTGAAPAGPASAVGAAGCCGSADKKTGKVQLSIKALEQDQHKKAIEEYGSSDSGASLGDILGAAIQEASASKKPAAKKKSKNDDAEDAA
jgi:predicted RNA-binding protein with RPS1 domain